MVMNKMEVKDIERDEIIKNWWMRIKASESLKKGYARSMVYFFQFLEEKGIAIGRTPGELRTYAKRKVKEDATEWLDDIEGTLAAFENWLNEKPKAFPKSETPMKLAPNTVARYIAAVRSFFGAYNIPMPKGKGRREPQVLVENNHRLTKEIVREAIKYADVREKAIILTMMTSGMGDSEILNVTVGDFVRGRGYNPDSISDLVSWVNEEKRKCEEAIGEGNLDFGITRFDVRRKKTQIDYMSFITPEGTLAILDYLAWRNRASGYSDSHKGTGRIREEKRKVRTPEDFLFIKKDVPEYYLPPEVIQALKPPREEIKELKDKRATKITVDKVKEKRKELSLKEYPDEVRKFDVKGIMGMFRQLAKKAGIDTKFGVYQVLRGHNLRKLFYTLLRNEGIDSFTLEFWQGHKIPKEQAAYFEAIPEKLKAIYAKYMHVLFIGEFETKVLASKEYAELKEEIDGYKEALKNRNGEMAKLKEEIEAMKERKEKTEEEALEKITRLQKILEKKGII
uniref:Core-binding (CB) domain-containing protein n=1 Tax=Candidatus Methanophagaceae archaeon ANME-1 ERB6 TaxID=2759912 RepID=A0A7G9YZF0_9EURY|nr:hypothetical protein OJFPBHNK_00010 [Methanosarcinales archaeon ANME-1 ERB6]